MTINKCPFCNNKYEARNDLYQHMESEHEQDLLNLPASQVYFNYRNNKTGGKCVICKKPTLFNIKTEKYERLCSDPKCKETYIENMRQNMMKVHGKENLLNDPDVQKKMLSKRKISGEYVWKDGYKHQYTGTYEKDFLEFMELFLGWENPNDILMPASHTFNYKFEGKDHFYIPDIQILSIDLFIEIKGTNNHYQKRDLDKELAKDNTIMKTTNRYIKLVDKKYTPLIDFMLFLKNNN